MIQRIQTTFLLLSVVAIVTAIILPLGFIHTDNINSYPLFCYGADIAKENININTWGLMGILAIVGIIEFGTIFLYKNRILQMRFISFSSIMIIGFYIASAIIFYFSIYTDEYSFRINWALSLPLIAIILNFLAIKNIAKDEALVRSADRLR